MEAVGVEIAGELMFETAAEAIMADTMAIASAEVASAGLAIGGGLTAEAIASGALAGDVVGGVVGESVSGSAGNIAGDIAKASETYGSGPATTQMAGEAAKQPLSQQILDGSVPDTGPGTSPEVATRAEQAFTDGAKPVPGKSKGIIDSVMDWAKSTPGATVLGQTAMGAMQGAGTAAGAKEAAKRKAASDAALLAQSTDEKLRLSREGAYAGGPGVSPSGQKVLRRADGSLVYLPNGLIASAMG